MRSLASQVTLLAEASFSLCEKKDNNSYLEELLRRLEIKDVKCLVRSGYSINASDCLGLSFMLCHSDGSSAQLWLETHNRAWSLGGRSLPARLLASSLGQAAPQWALALEGLEGPGDAVARHPLLGNALFLLAWLPP